MTWCCEQLAYQAVVGLVVALGGWFVSACGVLPGVTGWIGSQWIFLVEGRVVPLVYPPFGGWEEVCTGYGVGAVAGGLWAITLGADGWFTLGAGWMFYFAVEYGGISGGGLGKKMSRMRVRDFKRSV